ncbi:MAG: sulfonate transport system substrate-binding protein [Pseudonocardiales bacterium]|nr:sulfonate transport system substrate-binding protein [Pseudonocardiales bacterium]
MSAIRLHPRRSVAALVALVALTALAACSSASGANSKKDGYTLRIGFISNTPTPAGPEGWAEHTGILGPGLKAAGVKAVKFIPFKNGPDLSAAISGGSLDLATLGDTPALTAKAGGIGTRLVNQATVGQDTWLFTKKGGATSLAALRGKTIATQVGSYMYRYLVALLQQNGLAGQVKITHIYTTNAVAALQSGGIAAYAAPAGQLTAVLQQQGFPILDKASADHRDLLGTSVTVITNGALTAHPDLPAAWNAVRAKSIADLTANSDAYYAFAAKATGTTPDVVKGSIPVTNYKTEPFTPAGIALLQATDAFLAKNKLSKAVVDINGWKVPQIQG